MSTAEAVATGRRLPVIALIGLALLAAPRVVLHDLEIIHEGSIVNALFVFVPPLIWAVVIVAGKVSRPFVTAVLIGLLYGVFLAIGHQLLWSHTWAGQPPRLGGNLAGLSDSAQAVIIRSFAVFSSLVTGTVVGVITGAVAWLVNRLINRS